MLSEADIKELRKEAHTTLQRLNQYGLNNGLEFYRTRLELLDLILQGEPLIQDPSPCEHNQTQLEPAKEIKAKWKVTK